MTQDVTREYVVTFHESRRGSGVISASSPEDALDRARRFNWDRRLDVVEAAGYEVELDGVVVLEYHETSD